VGVQDAGKSGMHKKKRARLDDVLESGEPLKKNAIQISLDKKELKYFF
jgi:hypothetical protein